MKHVVVGILTRKNSDGIDEYLLVRSKRDFGEFTGCWYPPGGHLEAGEDEQIALRRELREELRLDVEPTKKIAETDSDVQGQRTHWWHCTLLRGDMQVDTNEIEEARYVTQAQMSSLPLWPTTKKFFTEHIFTRK